MFNAAPPAHTPFWNVPDGTLVREESIPGMWPSPAVWVIIGGTHYKLAGRERARGWGLFLIKHMVDELDTASDGSHHSVRLTLHLKGGPDAARPL